MIKRDGKNETELSKNDSQRRSLAISSGQNSGRDNAQSKDSKKFIQKNESQKNARLRDSKLGQIQSKQ